ncbi:hypothetical protein ACQP2K_31415 [Microbispora siamensis]
MPYFLTLHFQDVLGYDAVESGLAFLGPTLAITAGNLAAERLIPCLGLRGTLILGRAVGATGTAALAWRLSADGSYLGLPAGVVGFGLGAGLTGEALRAATAGGLRSAVLVAAVISVAGVVVTPALRPARRDRLADHA